MSGRAVYVCSLLVPRCCQVSEVLSVVGTGGLVVVSRGNAETGGGLSLLATAAQRSFAGPLHMAKGHKRQRGRGIRSVLNRSVRFPAWARDLYDGIVEAGPPCAGKVGWSRSDRTTYLRGVHESLKELTRRVEDELGRNAAALREPPAAAAAAAAPAAAECQQRKPRQRPKLHLPEAEPQSSEQPPFEWQRPRLRPRSPLGPPPQWRLKQQLQPKSKQKPRQRSRSQSHSRTSSEPAVLPSEVELHDDGQCKEATSAACRQDLRHRRAELQQWARLEGESQSGYRGWHRPKPRGTVANSLLEP